MGLRSIGADRLAATAFVTLFVLAACDEDALVEPDAAAGMAGAMADTGDDAGRDSSAAVPENVGPTYYGDVQPIVARNCQGCHQPGGIGPFNLVDYEDVRAVGPLVKSATATRRMPPFLPDNSGDCATYHDAMWLAQDEIDLIGAWVDAGMNEGDPTMAVEMQPLTELNDATNLAEMAVEYAPNPELSDDYRCFVLEDDLPDDITTYITDYEIVPGDTRVVHHVIVYQPTSEEALAAAIEADEAEPGPGYSCFGGSGTSARMLLNWSPGTGVTRHPEQTGVTVDPGLPFVMQIHYNLANGSHPDRTQVRLKVADQVPYPMNPMFVPVANLRLPPGESEIVVSDEIVGGSLVGLGVVPAQIMGVRAHMHGAGTRMKIERLRDGQDDTCLVDIPRYDYGWQRSYFLDDPVHLAIADRLRITCVYDTTAKTDLTTWGEGTDDEMCLATVYMIRREL